VHFSGAYQWGHCQLYKVEAETDLLIINKGDWLTDKKKIKGGLA
jgi:hypothetical protein